jgi:hypothetical protein
VGWSLPTGEDYRHEPSLGGAPPRGLFGRTTLTGPCRVPNAALRTAVKF